MRQFEAVNKDPNKPPYPWWRFDINPYFRYRPVDIKIPFDTVPIAVRELAEKLITQQAKREQKDVTIQSIAIRRKSFPFRGWYTYLIQYHLGKETLVASVDYNPKTKELGNGASLGVTYVYYPPNFN